MAKGQELGDLVEEIERPIEIEIDEEIVVGKDEDRMQIEYA